MVGRRCGFNIRQDRLRIPSTKNICLIGESRSYVLENEHKAEIERQQLLNERCGPSIQTQFKSGLGHDLESDEFQTGEIPSQELIHQSHLHSKKTVSFTPRPAVQAVRNCTKLNRDLVEDIVNTIAGALLQQDETKVLQSISSGHDLQQSDNIHWRRGGQLSISRAAALFEAEKMAQLKSEYGGLQTLLRNQHQVFEVTKGIIQLRDWRDEPVRSRKQQRRGPYSRKGFKTRLCWFYMNHPDGCPRTSADCSYAHGISELSVSVEKHHQ
jgi:tRNASer (uridine44-2'-O)-methyltransferase